MENQSNVLEFPTKSKVEVTEVDVTEVKEPTNVITEENLQSLPEEFASAYAVSKELDEYVTNVLNSNGVLVRELKESGASNEEIASKSVTSYIMAGVLTNQVIMEAVNGVMYSEFIELMNQGTIPKDSAFQGFLQSNFGPATQQLNNHALAGLGMVNNLLAELTPEQAIATLACMTKIVADQAQLGWFRYQKGLSTKEAAPVEVTEETAPVQE